MLPGMDGLKFAKIRHDMIKTTTEQHTARDCGDKTAGVLTQGADDYMDLNLFALQNLKQRLQFCQS